MHGMGDDRMMQAMSERGGQQRSGSGAGVMEESTSSHSFPHLGECSWLDIWRMLWSPNCKPMDEKGRVDGWMDG